LAFLTRLAGAAPHGQGRAFPGHCYTEYGDALPGIFDDLAKYSTTGITLAMVDEMRRLLAMGDDDTPLAKDGAAFVIVNNTLFVDPVTNATHMETYAYGAHLNRLLKRYEIPDVAFFISVSDHRDQRLDDQLISGAAPMLPIMRSCRTLDSANVLLPTFRLYASRVWRPDFSTNNTPFEQREDAIFSAYSSVNEWEDGRFTARFNERGEPDMDVRATMKRFAGGSDPASWRVRPLIDVRHEDIRGWGRYKYVMHVEGVTCSNKLEQAAMLGSVLFVEESGYLSALHRMLRPWVHYVPFYRFLPQELRDGLNLLAQLSPEVARGIAARGAAFARRYSSLDGIGCQLMLVLHEYARLQRFAPAQLLKSRPLLGFEEALLAIPAQAWLGRERIFDDVRSLRRWETWLLDADAPRGSEQYSYEEQTGN